MGFILRIEVFEGPKGVSKLDFLRKTKMENKVNCTPVSSTPVKIHMYFLYAVN